MSATLQENGLIIRRRQRFDEDAWQKANSWLGGRPSIEPSDWPRGARSGLPLHHLAQIDLGELPKGAWSDVLPQEGLLCFFLDTQLDSDHLDSKVIYVPSANLPQTEPPADTPPIAGENWIYEDQHRCAATPEEAAKTMWRWCVDFVSAEFELEYDEEEGVDIARTTPSLDELLCPKVESVHLLKSLEDSSSEGGIIPWDAARRVLASLKRQDSSKAQISSPEFEQFNNYWRSKIVEHHFHSLMSASDVQKLEQGLNELRTACDVRTRYGGGTSALHAAAGEAYLEMMIGPREHYEKIPQKVREHFETKRRRSGYSKEACHQLFGIGRDVQGQVEEREDMILLFQADTDEMMSWMWGDVGVLQFWMTPEDLASQNWDAVEGLFTGH